VTIAAHTSSADDTSPDSGETPISLPMNHMRVT